MPTFNSTSPHPRDLVAQIIQDTDQADALFALLVLADGSTPRGAAIRQEAIKLSFVYTHQGNEAVEQAAAEVAA